MPLARLNFGFISCPLWPFHEVEFLSHTLNVFFFEKRNVSLVNRQKTIVVSQEFLNIEDLIKINAILNDEP